jgi:hypothetical protein
LVVFFFIFFSCFNVFLFFVQKICALRGGVWFKGYRRALAILVSSHKQLTLKLALAMRLNFFGGFFHALIPLFAQMGVLVWLWFLRVLVVTFFIPQHFSRLRALKC